MTKRIELLLSAAFLVAMAFAGFTAAGRPVLIKNDDKYAFAKPGPSPKYNPEELVHIRRFCSSYYAWREQQQGHKGIPGIDQLCFDTQEMKP